MLWKMIKMKKAKLQATVNVIKLPADFTLYVNEFDKVDKARNKYLYLIFVLSLGMKISKFDCMCCFGFPAGVSRASVNMTVVLMKMLGRYSVRVQNLKIIQYRT